MRRTTVKTEPHKWEFKPRFRRGPFGWRSQPAIQRVKRAVSEVKGVARNAPALAAAGAVILLERLSPALERVDSSSGAIGSAVNRAITELVPIIASAPADPKTREGWLERLWNALRQIRCPASRASPTPGESSVLQGRSPPSGRTVRSTLPG